MRKIFGFMIAGLFGFAVSGTFASGIFESFVVLNLNGGGNSFYDLDSATDNPDFNGAFLGTFDPSTDSLNISGGQIKTFEDPNDDATDAQVFWRIYLLGDTPGGFLSWGLTDQGLVGNDRTWEDLTHSFNEVSILSPGTYVLEVYGRAGFSYDDGQGSSGTFEVFANNSGQNHIATFEVVPEPTAFLLAALGITGAGLLLRRQN